MIGRFAFVLPIGTLKFKKKKRWGKVDWSALRWGLVGWAESIQLEGMIKSQKKKTSRGGGIKNPTYAPDHNHWGSPKGIKGIGVVS